MNVTAYEDINCKAKITPDFTKLSILPHESNKKKVESTFLAANERVKLINLFMTKIKKF